MENLCIVVSATSDCYSELDIRKESEIVRESVAKKIFKEKKKKFLEIVKEQDEAEYETIVDSETEFIISSIRRDIMSVRILVFIP